MSDRPAVEWEPAAQRRAMTLADDDPDGVLAVFDCTDLLTADPRPNGAFPYGPGTVRLQIGLYRVLAEIDDARRVVRIIHIGRTKSWPSR
jgi:mRNA-degrading endonuclease RelE of RelBE toxin-antitoxin system